MKKLDLHWHDLRHECASRWRESGLDLEVIRRLLGHSTLPVTQRYLNINEDELVEAMQQKIWKDATEGLEESLIRLSGFVPPSQITRLTGTSELASLPGKWWCRGAELNCRHHDFQSCALPTELPRHEAGRR